MTLHPCFQPTSPQLPVPTPLRIEVRTQSKQISMSMHTHVYRVQRWFKRCVFDDPIWPWREMVQHKKKIPDHTSVCSQREDRKWSMRWRAWLAGFVNCQEFSHKSEFVLYLFTSEHPAERNKVRRDMVSFRNTEQWWAMFWTFSSLF